MTHRFAFAATLLAMTALAVTPAGAQQVVYPAAGQAPVMNQYFPGYGAQPAAHPQWAAHPQAAAYGHPAAYAQQYGQQYAVPVAHQPLAESVPAQPVPQTHSVSPPAAAPAPSYAPAPAYAPNYAPAPVAAGGCSCSGCSAGGVVSPMPAAGGCAGGVCDNGVGCDAGGCDSGACDAVWGDESCDCDVCCATGSRKFRLFGEYLYLRPRSAEVAYAVPIDGPISNPADVPVQVGPTALVDPKWDSGYRVGFELATGCDSGLVVTFTDFENSKNSSAVADTPQVLFPLVIHPTTFNAATTVTNAFAEQAIRYELVDLDWRVVARNTCQSRVHYLVGTRYARLDQEFNSQFNMNGNTFVNSDISFDGIGFRFGLDGERFVGCHGFSAYGRGMANFLAGEFRGRYQQTDSFAPLVAQTSWKSGRIVPILELETGIAWRSCNDRWRIHAGYMMTAWFNSLKTEEFIEAVQTNRLDDLSDTFTFDGFNAGLEYRY